MIGSISAPRHRTLKILSECNSSAAKDQAQKVAIWLVGPKMEKQVCQARLLSLRQEVTEQRRFSLKRKK